VKICDTGEVLFFKTGGEAERQARRLAAAYPGFSEVLVHDRQGRGIGRWLNGASVLEAAPAPALADPSAAAASVGAAT
jgi:hypothetical protein